MNTVTGAITTYQLPLVREEAGMVYVVLRQRPIKINSGTTPDDLPTDGYISDYQCFTSDEWNKYVLSTLWDSTQKQLSTELDDVRLNKIQQSKDELDKYLELHPMSSTVHNPKGALYNATLDSQSRLSTMILTCKICGVQPQWHSTGEVNEPWTLDELITLLGDMSKYVDPLVAKQQAYERQILQMTNINDIRSLDIKY